MYLWPAAQLLVVYNEGTVREGEGHVKVVKFLYKVSSFLLIVACALMLAVCALILSSCSSPKTVQENLEHLNSINRPFNLSGVLENEVDKSPLQLNIVSVGDIIFHYPWMQEYDAEGASIYPEYFRYINDFTRQADLALCNIEAPLAGGELFGYPTFNAGDSIAPSVYEAGFDVVYTSHNHMLDQHSDAVFRTMKVLRESGLQTTGSRLNISEPNYALIEVRGVSIAIIAYTYESSPNMLNGLPVSANMDPLINSFTYGSEEDLAEMQAVIHDSRQAGADLVIFYLHAGTEYSREVDQGQQNTAEFLVENGVDVIFGSHVHVVQTMELLSPSDGSTPVPVYWGMGNYISSQIKEGGMELENEEGIMADLSLTWNPATKEIDALVMNYLPLWTCYDATSERLKYTTVPERPEVSENPSVVSSGKYERALSAFAEIHTIMGEPISWQRSAE